MKPIDPKIVHRLFYPSVPVVLCASYGERRSAMPVVSYASLSEEPALVGLSCFRGSSTLKTALRARCFALCILDRKYSSSVEFLGTHTGKRMKDKISASGLTPVKAKKIACYVIKESSAVVECLYMRKIKTGDHFLLVGKVAEVYASEDFDDYWRFKSYKPILYTGMKGGFSLYGT